MGVAVVEKWTHCRIGSNLFEECNGKNIRKFTDDRKYSENTLQVMLWRSDSNNME